MVLRDQKDWQSAHEELVMPGLQSESREGASCALLMFSVTLYSVGA